MPPNASVEGGDVIPCDEYIFVGYSENKTIDTSEYIYNWNQEYVKRELTDVKGELFYNKTFFA